MNVLSTGHNSIHRPVADTPVLVNHLTKGSHVHVETCVGQRTHPPGTNVTLGSLAWLVPATGRGTTTCSKQG